MWKRYIWNTATCSCENEKYLASIMDDLVITCHKIIEYETTTVTTSFKEKNEICKTKEFLYFTWLFINYHCIIDSC